MLRETMLLALVSLVTLAAPGAAQSVQAAADSAPIQWSACPPPPEGLPDAGQECAILRVPLDYRAPHGRKIDLAISRVRSTQCASPPRRTRRATWT